MRRSEIYACSCLSFLIFSAGSAFCQAPVSFLPPVNYPTGGYPRSVAVGDFNGDGKPDVAVANYYGNDVSVLLGNGDGTFRSAVNYPVSYFPDSVAVGDFNGDGKLDLAVSNNSGTVSLLLGNGDGTFQAAMNYPAGSSPQSLAVGDFNRDGKADLAVADYYGVVSVLLGNGDGTFQAAVSYAAGMHPGSVATGDLNGDGKPDLAVADIEGSVSVLLGKGGGTFQPAKSFAVPLNPYSLAIGDFNGDGKPDLAVASYIIGGRCPQQKISEVSVLLGNGNGTFQPAVTYSGGMGSNSVVVGDFNGDGRPDLAVGSVGGEVYLSFKHGCIPVPGEVNLLLGNGDGTFSSGGSFAVGSQFDYVAVGDFNGDGKWDIRVEGEPTSIFLAVCEALGQDRGRGRRRHNHHT